MTTLIFLRAILSGWILLGWIVNAGEVRAMYAIRRRLRTAKTNGLKHASAADKLSAARFRLFYSTCLCGQLAIFFAAAPPPQHAVGLAVLMRLFALALAIAVTFHGIKARKGRKTLMDLIEAEENEAV